MRWYLVAILVVESATEATLTAALIGTVFRPEVIFIAHGLVSATLALMFVVLWRAGVRDPLVGLFVAATIFMGPFGAVGSALTAILRVLFRWRATPPEEWHAILFPQLETDPVRGLYQQLAFRGAKPSEASRVASFTDIMALGTVQQKQTVITLASDNFRPGFAPALRAALNDAEPAVRVQAATAAARIENHFLEQGMALEAARAKSPDDSEVLRHLASHAEAYADTGLLDPGRASAMRHQALALYQQYDSRKSGDLGTLASISRLQLRSSSPDEALRHAATCIASGIYTPPLISCYLEALYELGRFEDLRRTCIQFRSELADGNSSVGQSLFEAARLWLPVFPEASGRAANAGDR